MDHEESSPLLSQHGFLGHESCRSMLFQKGAMKEMLVVEGCAYTYLSGGMSCSAQFYNLYGITNIERK